MQTTVCRCPHCPTQFDEDNELPYILVATCPRCKLPFAILAFVVDDDTLYCCLSLNQKTMRSPSAEVKTKYIMALTEPYFPLMGFTATTRDVLHAEILKQMSASYEVCEEEFVDEGLFDEPAFVQTVQEGRDGRTTWLYHCRYCGDELVRAHTIFPPILRRPHCQRCYGRSVGVNSHFKTWQFTGVPCKN